MERKFALSSSKKVLSYNNVPHNHRIELRKFLEEKGHIGEGWFSFNPREDDGINLDCIEGFGNRLYRNKFRIDFNILL